MTVGCVLSVFFHELCESGVALVGKDVWDHVSEDDLQRLPDYY